jgi:hypothetical protein
LKVARENMNFIAEERKKRRETTFYKPRSFPS